MKPMRISFLFLVCASLQTASAQINFPFDFETENSTPVFADFEAAETTVVANPNPNDNNPSATVAQMIRQPGGEIWAGSLVTLPDYLDLSEVGAIRMKVHAPLAGSVMKMKLEGNGVTELDAITTVGNDWEELEWDFTGLPSGVFNQLAFMLDFGLYGDGTVFSTFYFDDVELFDGAGDLIQVDLPITHEDPDTHYQTTSFAGNFSETSVDPADETNKVTKVTKHWLALDYSGTTVSTPLGLASPIAFEPGFATISVDVYTPTAGVAVRLKAEEYGDMSHSVETQVNTGAAYEWQTLTFDFTQPVPGTQAINYGWDYRILSIFFDFGYPGYLSGSTSYYYDNVTFNGNPSSVADIESEKAWLFPNYGAPGQVISIQTQTDGWLPMDIIGAQGALIQRTWVRSGAAFSVPNLCPGAYLFRIGSGENARIQRFIVQ
jgi:hypothetical protein